MIKIYYENHDYHTTLLETCNLQSEFARRTLQAPYPLYLYFSLHCIADAKVKRLISMSVAPVQKS